MNIKSDFNSLLSKKMDRKGFLSHLMIVMLTFLGINGILKALRDEGVNRENHANGYGESTYGGTVDGTKS